MPSIIDILSQSGALPIEELKIRSSESPDNIETRIGELTSRGMVEVSYDPYLKETEALKDDRLIKLTTKGLRASISSR